MEKYRKFSIPCELLLKVPNGTRNMWLVYSNKKWREKIEFPNNSPGGVIWGKSERPERAKTH